MTVGTFLEKAFSRCGTVRNHYFCTYGNTELDYASFHNASKDTDHQVEIDDWFEVTVTPGACEGAYIEIYMVRYSNGETTRSCVGAIKTLETSQETYQDLGRLAGEMLYHMLHINIREE